MALRFKILASTMLSLVVFQTAVAAEFMVVHQSTPQSSETSKSMIRLTGVKSQTPSAGLQPAPITTTNTPSSAAALKVQRLQMLRGGSDSGGGQGVYDARTGLIHFADILSSEDLSQMQLVDGPELTVFSKFPPCSKYINKDFYEKYRPVEDQALAIVDHFAPYLGENIHHFHDAAFFEPRFITPFHLRQLRDATNVPAKYQFQLAIYNEGIAFFQEQALTMMPSEELKWLVLKEILRSAANVAGIHVDNSEIQEVIRAMYKNDSAALIETTYFLKMMIPNFSLEYAGPVLDQEKAIENRLMTATLSPEERAFWENEIRLIEKYKVDPYEFRKNYDTSHEYFVAYGNWNSLPGEVSLGYLPAWAVELGSNEKIYRTLQISRTDGRPGFPLMNESANEAKRFHLYNIETGETYFSIGYGECSH